MLTPVYTTRFRKDLKLAEKRGKNLLKLKLILETLVSGDQPDPIHRDHGLLGKFHGRRECHIEADWLLIYNLEEDRIIFERMGTHSDLFR